MTVRQWFRQMRAADFARDIPPALGGSLLTEWGHWTLFDTQREVDKATTGHYWTHDYEFWFSLRVDDVAMPVLLPRPLDQKPALEEQWAQTRPIFSSKVQTSSPLTFDDIHQALGNLTVGPLPSDKDFLANQRAFANYQWPFAEGFLEPAVPRRLKQYQYLLTADRRYPKSGFEAALLADDEESRRDRAGQIHEGQPPTADHVSCPVSQGLDPAITAPLDVEAVRRVFQPKPRVYFRDGWWWCSDGITRYQGLSAAAAIVDFFNHRGDPSATTRL